MNYKKIYKNLMLSAKRENRKKNEGEYYEKHHIVPNFMFSDRKGRTGPVGPLSGNPDAADNIVLLTPREHFLSHILLCKIYKGTIYEYKARKSLIWFYTKLQETEHMRNDWYKMSSTKKYQRYRVLALEALSKEMKGKIIVKDAITGEKIGKVSVNHPNVVSRRWVHHTTGRKADAEERKALSQRNTGMSNPNARPDLTKTVLIEELISYVECNDLYGGYIKRKEIVKYFKEKFNCSEMIIINRFDNFATLIKETNEELYKRNKELLKYDPYYRDEAQRQKTRERGLQAALVTNSIKNLRLHVDEVDEFLEKNKDYRRGRVNNVKN